MVKKSNDVFVFYKSGSIVSMTHNIWIIFYYVIITQNLVKHWPFKISFVGFPVKKKSYLYNSINQKIIFQIYHYCIEQQLLGIDQTPAYPNLFNTSTLNCCQWIYIETLLKWNYFHYLIYTTSNKKVLVQLTHLNFISTNSCLFVFVI